MFSPFVSVLLALTGVALLLHRVGMWAALRFLDRNQTPPPPGTWPPVTLLKPIKGIEDGLERNLRSFYEQAYPAPLQVVFVSSEADDPGIAVARAVARDYPLVVTAFAVSHAEFGLNPKVANMHGGLLHARHDLVLQSDANVRLPPGYLERMVALMLGQDASLVGGLVVGTGERSAGALLENLQLTAFTAPGLCMAKELAGVTCVLGKAMLLRRSELEALGGLALVKDVLAEDFVLAQRYERESKRVLLFTEPVHNLNIHTSFAQFVSRHSRWLKMRAVVSVPGFAADLGSNPLPFALGACLAGGIDVRLVPLLFLVYAYKCAWDARLLRRLRGHGLGLHQLWATPARDLLLAGIWAYASVSRTTRWRGRRLRIGAGSAVMPDAGSPAWRWLRLAIGRAIRPTRSGR